MTQCTFNKKGANVKERENFVTEDAKSFGRLFNTPLIELMKMSKEKLLLLHAEAGTIPYDKLTRFVKDMLNIKNHAVGYPLNQTFELRDFYRWFLESGLCDIHLNNVGNPRKESILPFNTHKFENDVIDYFAYLLGFDKDDYWGIVTHSGTDGNMHAMYFGVNYLKSKIGSKNLPVVYVSEEAHYSIKRIADVMNLEIKLIPGLPMGQMDINVFEKVLDPLKPALVVIAIGTTFKGAIDDHKSILEIIERKKPPAYYIMLDAALFGGYLPFTKHRDIINRKKIFYHSIAVSGHKFFGSDEPMGIFITGKEVFDAQNPFKVGYLNDAVPTITCSRSALGALKFWWQLTRNGEKEYERQASHILETAQYLKRKLDELNYPVWLNPMSNTVFFKRPVDWIMKKWDLAPEYDERFGGPLAHEIIMQHENKKTVDEFIADMKKILGK